MSHIPVIALMISIAISAGNAVISGDSATLGEFPYMAYISIQGGMFSCGGVIISNTQIVTAAHCVKGVALTNLKVIVGEIQIDLSRNTKHAVMKSTVHADYKIGASGMSPTECIARSTLPCLNPPADKLLPRSDIAVLTLAGSLTLEGNVGKVSLPDSATLPYNEKCNFAGWGATAVTRNAQRSSTLKKTRLSPLSRNDCLASRFWHRKCKEFCAMDTSLTTCSADGDSGGALVCGGVVYGILSAGADDKLKPSLFTKVFDFKRFIEST